MRHITQFERSNGAAKHRTVSDKGLNLIKRFEGFSPTVYFCPAGYPTIGYGHVVKDNEEFSAGIDEAHAIALLRQDTVVAERAVLRLINVPLTSNQFDALVSFTYNLGGGALQSSTLRRKINRGEHNEAPEQFLRWVFAGGRKLKGLILRRQAEADLYQQVGLSIL
ncbi:lysozyme [Bartonella sp. DGB2]|uniref:lysozyme n=1 Tax=Bartonella sp. DGB2 TaxID=3388426 RepID=UPI00398F9891